ncbi:hypothetical protein [Pontixanthobacter sp.]
MIVTLTSKNTESDAQKKEWETPCLIDLDLDVEDVAANTGIGSDSFMSSS